jgi:hypothetical protein
VEIKKKESYNKCKHHHVVKKTFNFAHTHTDPVKSYDRGSSLQKLQLLFNVNCTIEKIYKITSVLDTFLFGWVSSDWIEVEGLVRSVTHVDVDGITALFQDY